MDTTVDELGLRRHEPDGGIAVRPQWILFVHGMWEAGGIVDGIWGEEKNIFPPFIQPFREAGYRCAVQLLPGYTEKLPVPKRGKVSFNTYLAAVRRAYDDLGDPIVVGHSLGGLLVQKLIEDVTPPAAVLLAPAAPQEIWPLKGLLLFAASHGIEIIGGRPLLPSRSEMDKYMLNGLPGEKERAKLYGKLQSASGLQAREISMPIVEGIPVRVNPEVPMCVAFGGNDKMTPPEIAEALVTKYGAKRLRYSDKAHMLTLERGWEKVAQDVLDWLEATIGRKARHG